MLKTYYNPFFILFILLSTFMLSACLSNTRQENQEQTRQWMADDPKVKVLSSTAMINDIVNQIGQEHASSITLIKGDLDPHSYELVKGDAEKFSRADVIFSNGLGLEHSPSIHYQLDTNPKAFALGDEIQQEYPNEILCVDGMQDPHIWMDVNLWSRTVHPIVKHLSEADPEHAEFYQKNGQELFLKMQEKDQYIRQQLQAVPPNKRYLVSSHDAFNYFTKHYLATEQELIDNDWQKRFQAPEGLAPESQLSTNDIQDILHHLKRYNIHMLFLESNVSADSINKILDAGLESGLHLTISDSILYADAMGEPGSGADTYFGMVQHNANAISSGLKQ